MDIISWLKDSWIIIATVVSGITVIWNFTHKTLNEIKNEWNKPIKQMNDKVDNVLKQLDEINEESKLRKRALLSLQRRSILDSCEVHLKRGYASVEERQTLHEQSKSYKELGGNSFVANLVESIDKLPYEKPQTVKKNRNKE